jgi:hypothetical protein
MTLSLDERARYYRFIWADKVALFAACLTMVQRIDGQTLTPRLSGNPLYGRRISVIEACGRLRAAEPWWIFVKSGEGDSYAGCSFGFS